jgi:hypothetical protein
MFPTKSSACPPFSDWILPPAAAANAVVQIDQMPAIPARVCVDLFLQQCFHANLSLTHRVGRKIDPVSFAVPFVKRLHALAWSIRTLRAGEQAALGNTRAHHAFALIFIRLALAYAATRAGFLAKVAIAQHAVQPARREHIDVDGFRRFHETPAF